MNPPTPISQESDTTNNCTKITLSFVHPSTRLPYWLCVTPPLGFFFVSVGVACHCVGRRSRKRFLKGKPAKERSRWIKAFNPSTLWRVLGENQSHPITSGVRLGQPLRSPAPSLRCLWYLNAAQRCRAEGGGGWKQHCVLLHCHPSFLCIDVVMSASVKVTPQRLDTLLLLQKGWIFLTFLYMQ